jgi:hypothetical protein
LFGKLGKWGDNMPAKTAVKHEAVNEDVLTARLGETVMGWRVAPDRFLRPGRSWLPRWRFRPFEDMLDALQLLERAADWFSLTSDCNTFTVHVRIEDREAKESIRIVPAESRVGDKADKTARDPRARAITIAIARALGIEML